MEQLDGLLREICKSEEITLHSHDGAGTIQGFAVNAQGDKGIYYNPEIKGWARIAVIAHEIGHHVLGHLDEKHSRPLEYIEQEARIFAAAFTAIALYNRHTCEMKNE